MPTAINASAATRAFETVVQELPRQHLRVKFHNHFGLGTLEFDDKMFFRGTVPAEADKPLVNLLQERPESIKVVALTGSAESMSGVEEALGGDSTLGDALLWKGKEQVVTIFGRRAKLVVYSDPAQGILFIRRLVTPLNDPTAAPKRPLRVRKAYDTPKGRSSRRPHKKNPRRGGNR